MSEQPDDPAFWQHIADQTRDTPLDSTRSEQMQARAAAEFLKGAPPRWRRWPATVIAIALCCGFLSWAIWQIW